MTPSGKANRHGRAGILPKGTPPVVDHRTTGREAMRLRMSTVCACVLALALTALTPAAASAWAPAATATVHPGVMTFTEGAQCTANFIYSDASNVYIGQAAHCSGTGGNTETNGCTSGSLPIGTPVEVDGASRPGTMVYNSWLTMQSRGEANADTCQYNDLALVKLDAADVPKVNPSVPRFGGPTGVGTAAEGETVYSYGNSSLRGGVSQLSPKQGTVVTTEGNGWSYTVYTATPGVPGDSGSGFLNSTGKAFGVLSTLQVTPVAGSNGVGDVGREIAYMHANSSFTGVQLEPGTESFNPDIVSAVVGR
jgi:hypothetical protein